MRSRRGDASFRPASYRVLCLVLAVSFVGHAAVAHARKRRGPSLGSVFRDVLANTPKKDRNAKFLAEAYAAKLRKTPLKRLPTGTCVAVDLTTGRAYWGNSGGRGPRHIAPEMLERMPRFSRENWDVSNCAEFRAVNAALLRGAWIESLEVHTVHTETGTPFPRCRNCMITTDGTMVTSD